MSDGPGQPADGGVVAGDLEQAEEAQQAEGAQRPEVDAEAQVEGQDGEQVDDAEEAADIGQPLAGDGDAEHVFHREHRDGDHLAGGKQRGRPGRQAGQRLDADGDRREGDEPVEHQDDAASENRMLAVERSLDMCPPVH